MIKKYYFFTQTIPNNRVMSSFDLLEKENSLPKRESWEKNKNNDRMPNIPKFKKHKIA
jgi:hypothetical protein